MAETTSYDDVLYDDYSFWYTHPNSLVTVARLHGIPGAGPERCRVLEIGCGTGSNLIPMACDLPESTFVGLDLSPAQIAHGQAVVNGLGLKNIELRAANVMDLGPEIGHFDYIICHGVYSWVPRQVQDKILSICKENLAPQGISYISYNTYPGWHISGMIREMMKFHVRQFDDPREQITQARALLHFLAETAGARDSVYGKLLKTQEENLGRFSDAYVFHEHLETENNPLYFYQFVERTEGVGLQYLGDAIPSPLAQSLTPEARATIDRLSTSLVAGEQYLDFVRNRTFRCTLLCHRDSAVQRPPKAEVIRGFHLRGLARLVPGDSAAAATGTEEFRTSDGMSIKTNHPLVRAVLRTLEAASPMLLSFDEVREAALKAWPENQPFPEAMLVDCLLQCYLVRLLNLWASPPRFVRNISERPTTSPLTRWLATHGRPVVDGLHGTHGVDPFDRAILSRLDGTRNRADLEEALMTALLTGEIPVTEKSDPESLRSAIRDRLERSLQRLAAQALLTS